ncbi:MAG: hypothetical protein AAB373_02105 [Patescibacteria group bacterium]
MKKLITTIIGLAFILTSLMSTFLPMANAETALDIVNKALEGEDFKKFEKTMEKANNPKSQEEIEQEKAKKTSDSLGEALFPVNEVLILDNGEQPKKYFNDKNNSPIVSFVIDVIDFFTTIMGTVAVILFIAAGFMLMIANGEQQTIDKAKEIIKYGILGLVITFLSYVIVISVQSVFIAD